MPTFRVVTRGAELDDELRTAFGAAGIQPVAGHSSRTTAGPGGRLPEVDTWSLLVDAADGDEAAGAVESALDSIGRPLPVIVRVEPVG